MSPRVALPAALVTAAGMIAFPLAGRGRRVAVSNAVVAGLATTTAACAARRWGPARAVAAASVVAAGTAAVERAGVATGVPFGRYRYTGSLRPTVARVPVAVPAAWWAMAAPAREVAHAVLGWRSSPVRRAVLGAVALTAWDLFLDPQMTAEDYWTWQRPGRYRGIPLTNFAGWLVTGAALMAALEVLLPPGAPDGPLVAEYVAMGAMETVGFAGFFADRTVAAIGGAAMLPLGALAVARIVRG